MVTGAYYLIMSSSSVAGVITAIATVITALGGLFLALAVFLPTLRAAKSAEIKAARAEVTATATHVLVNQLSTDKDNYIAALRRELITNNIPVPLDQSMGTPPSPTYPE